MSTWSTWNSHMSLVVMPHGRLTLENVSVVSYNQTTLIWPSHSTSSMHPRKEKAKIQVRIDHVNVHSQFICNNWKLKTVPFSGQMYKLWDAHTREYFSATKNNALLVNMTTWINHKDINVEWKTKSPNIIFTCFHWYDILKKTKVSWWQTDQWLPRVKGGLGCKRPLQGDLGRVMESWLILPTISWSREMASKSGMTWQPGHPAHESQKNGRTVPFSLASHQKSEFQEHRGMPFTMTGALLMKM